MWLKHLIVFVIFKRSLISICIIKDFVLTIFLAESIAVSFMDLKIGPVSSTGPGWVPLTDFMKSVHEDRTTTSAIVQVIE